MYTIETLKEINQSYDHQHHINEKDVTTANIYKELVERSRSRLLNRPQIGDIVMIDGKRAHVETVEGDTLGVCRNAYTPFIRGRIMDSTASISTNTSGGPWESVKVSDLVDTRTQEEKRFCFFGHVGACANGGVDLIANVNVYIKN